MKAMAIIAEIAAAHDVPVAVLRSRRNPLLLAPARRAAMRRIRAETRLSYGSIGILFGRNFATVWHHVNRASA